MLTEPQLRDAFIFWFGTYQHRGVDRDVAGFLNLRRSSNWLCKVREAQHLTKKEVAARLKISNTTYSEFEEGEINMTISLRSLNRAARAMDCELIYAVRPLNKEKFAWPLWQKLVEVSMDHPWVKKRPEMFKARALAAAARTNEKKLRRLFTKNSQRKPGEGPRLSSEW